MDIDCMMKWLPAFQFYLCLVFKCLQSNGLFSCVNVKGNINIIIVDFKSMFEQGNVSLNS